MMRQLLTAVPLLLLILLIVLHLRNVAGHRNSVMDDPTDARSPFYRNPRKRDTQQPTSLDHNVPAWHPAPTPQSVSEVVSRRTPLLAGSQPRPPLRTLDRRPARLQHDAHIQAYQSYLTDHDSHVRAHRHHALLESPWPLRSDLATQSDHFDLTGWDRPGGGEGTRQDACQLPHQKIPTRTGT